MSARARVFVCACCVRACVPPMCVCVWCVQSFCLKTPSVYLPALMRDRLCCMRTNTVPCVYACVLHAPQVNFEVTANTVAMCDVATPGDGAVGFTGLAVQQFSR